MPDFRYRRMRTSAGIRPACRRVQPFMSAASAAAEAIAASTRRCPTGSSPKTIYIDPALSASIVEPSGCGSPLSLAFENRCHFLHEARHLVLNLGMRLQPNVEVENDLGKPAASTLFSVSAICRRTCRSGRNFPSGPRVSLCSAGRPCRRNTDSSEVWFSDRSATPE